MSRRREQLLKEARNLRNMASIFTKYQDELDDKADILEEEAISIPIPKKRRARKL